MLHDEKKTGVGAALLAIALCSCSTMTLSKPDVEQVKRVAVIGFSVEQQQPNTGERVLTKLFGPKDDGISSLKPAKPARESAHAGQMLEDLEDVLRKQMHWQVVDSRTLSKNATYRGRWTARTQGLQPRPLVPGDNWDIFVAPGVVESFLLENLTLAERQDLMKKLGVDAVVVAKVRVDLVNRGISLGGELAPKSKLHFRLFTSKQEDPIWNDLNADGPESKAGVEHSLGFADPKALNPLALESVRGANRVLISRYQQ